MKSLGMHRISSQITLSNSSKIQRKHCNDHQTKLLTSEMQLPNFPQVTYRRLDGTLLQLFLWKLWLGFPPLFYLPVLSFPICSLKSTFLHLPKRREPRWRVLAPLPSLIEREGNRCHFQHCSVSNSSNRWTLRRDKQFLLNACITESHRIQEWRGLEGTFENHLVPPSCQGRILQSKSHRNRFRMPPETEALQTLWAASSSERLKLQHQRHEKYQKTVLKTA